MKEEIAQPAHEAEEADPFGCGLLIRGPEPSTVVEGGSAVSGILAAAFLSFCM